MFFMDTRPGWDIWRYQMSALIPSELCGVICEIESIQYITI
jgi:hypothetical protein